MPGKEGKLCPTLPQCIFTTSAENLQNADAIVFENSQLPVTYIKSEMPLTRSPHQQWIWFISECPNYLTIDLNSYSGVFNWTITYRTDSDVSGAWGSLHMVYSRLKGADLDPNTDYSVGKTKLVVWFISKCSSRAQRIVYAKELIKYIHVDIFGKCGRIVCEKQDFACTVQYIRQYKFYLAFENMKCKEYITEKFWRHALSNNVVPVVFGAPKKDYEYLTPPNSFIHVDDFESPKALAGYLKLLDTDTEMYNQYFKWKTNPPQNIPLDNGVWCNLCRKLIRICPDTRKMYTNLEKWYRGENNDQCVPLRNGTYHEVQFASDGSQSNY
ncbi:PREDICTED: glycoprotein 3-alpha-L-fucosyltransferase A-like [Branchiostoma belcheri]|uniref:Fucosyltransferase n=1 Tax=Branchiostoma belcheri TaxID=7741 RepID=A0A6P4Z429_BRABE|nr:PREDICTED: glycoprotein 3-alpha-L-fucosyltransferase A-like [Branchiostoma belcheri]